MISEKWIQTIDDLMRLSVAIGVICLAVVAINVISEILTVTTLTGVIFLGVPWLYFKKFAKKLDKGNK